MKVLYAVVAGVMLLAPRLCAEPGTDAASKTDAAQVSGQGGQRSPEVSRADAPAPARAKIAGRNAKGKKTAAALTRAQAEKIALERAKGAAVKEAELEKEHGKLVWSFDLEQDGKIREILVNAVSGKIIEDKIESPAAEAAEQAKDAVGKNAPH